MSEGFSTHRAAKEGVEGGVRVDHPDQVGLEADPPRCLSYRWHTFTLELGEAVGIDEETRAGAAAEPARP